MRDDFRSEVTARADVSMSAGRLQERMREQMRTLIAREASKGITEARIMVRLGWPADTTRYWLHQLLERGDVAVRADHDAMTDPKYITPEHLAADVAVPS